MLGLLRSLQTDMKTGFEQVDQRFEQIDTRLVRLEESVLDLRDEVRGESTATRALLNQAFDHLSDQIASESRVPTPSPVFVSRAHKPVAV